MLDHRLLTFLTLCQTKSYTKAAEILCITQPAVTQHIHFLQKSYGVKLFYYRGKNLLLTPQGELLEKMVTRMHADTQRIPSLLMASTRHVPHIHFGATLTIGQFTMPPILSAYLARFPDIDLHMCVDNTKTLLHMLHQGEIDFALVEGYFDKQNYAYQLFSSEKFICVCSPSHPLAGKSVSLETLVNNRIILREKGSGTRNILEAILEERNMSLRQFPSLTEIGSIDAIKQLVLSGTGITFIYEEAVKKELMNHSLSIIALEQPDIIREFNLVYLEGSIFEEEYLSFLLFCQQNRHVSNC